jgi:hypothetical protein
MATNPDTASAKTTRKYAVAGRNRFTGGYVLKPSAKGATRTLAQIRAAIKAAGQQA